MLHLGFTDLPPLFLVAGAFAFITGANDGASLLTINLQSQALPPLRALAVLGALVILGPFVLGTAVATTFAHGLVAFQGNEDALLLAVLTAVGLVFVLGRLGFPTSVTQALLGGIVGIGLGRGLFVDWDTVTKAVLILLLAPLAAGALGYLGARAINRLPHRHDVRIHLRRLHGTSFALQCIAYAANDAQKMIAVFAIATGSLGTAVILRPDTQLLIGGLFVAGTLFGLPRLAPRLGSRLLRIQPLNAIAAGYASSLAVLTSAALGAPVSMAQASSAALVGSEAAASYRRVRLGQAGRILAAWGVTLPSAALIALTVGAITRP